MAFYYGCKPIYYRGVYFRSTLEASWAAFFHYLSKDWHYEFERVTLPSGDSYLPDFWLPEPNVHIEIKPDYSFGVPERYKEFVQHTKRPLLFIAGKPQANNYHLRYYAVESEHSSILLGAHFFEYKDKLWISDGQTAVALTFDAQPRQFYPGLSMSSRIISAAMEYACAQVKLEATRPNRE